MLTDEPGRRHDAVALGAESHWHRRTNRYPGCSCPEWRYHPLYPKPTDPDCSEHGMNQA